MRTKKTRKLRLSKETIADLNTKEMRLIVGGTQRSGSGVTDSCEVCNSQDEEYTISNCPITCGESCH
jgi:natural product precursor